MYLEREEYKLVMNRRRMLGFLEISLEFNNFLEFLEALEEYLYFNGKSFESFGNCF